MRGFSSFYEAAIWAPELGNLPKLHKSRTAQNMYRIGGKGVFIKLFKDELRSAEVVPRFKNFADRSDTLSSWIESQVQLVYLFLMSISICDCQ